MVEAVAATPAKQKKSRKKWIALLIILVIFIGIGGATYAFRRTLTSPVEGTVIESVAPATPQPPVELAQFDGTTFSFVHPMPYIEQATKPQPNELESHTFVSTGIVSKLLTAIVTKLPSGNLNDEPSYYMRAQNSAKYKMKTVNVKNEKVVIFTSSDPQQFQQVAYWAHGGKLLTFSMTGVASDVPALTSEFNDMVNSISWR